MNDITKKANTGDIEMKFGLLDGGEDSEYNGTDIMEMSKYL